MRFTQKQKLEQFDALYEQNQRNEIALGNIIRGEAEWSPWVKEENGDCKYRVAHVGADRGSGGFMIVSMRCEKTGQRDSVSQAYYWDEHKRMVEGSYSEYARIVVRCIVALNRSRVTTIRERHNAVA